MYGKNSCFRRSAAAALLVFLAACSDRQQGAKIDSDLARDLALAGRVNPAPQFQDTVIAPAAVTPPPNVVTRRAPARVADRPTPQQTVPEPRPVAEAPAPAPA